MGGITFRRGSLLSVLSEHAGYKAGVALNERQLRAHLPHHADYLVGRKADNIHLRSEELDEIAAELLYALGNTRRRTPLVTPVQAFLERHGRDPGKLKVYEKVQRLFLETAGESTSDAPIDLTPMLEKSRYMDLATQRVVLEFIDDLQLMTHQSIFSQMRQVAWSDVAELKDLFRSESLETQYGTFLDQRYIDYLASNFDAIDKINWRKFEGLTAEFFKRLGLQVVLSNGRDDGNIDVRVWPAGGSVDTPPSVIIQCKREKAKVGKVVVKALYADILDEKAKSGLVVTVRELLPGAAEVCRARGYPIGQANRGTLRTWLEVLRTPGTGIFQGY